VIAYITSKASKLGAAKRDRSRSASPPRARKHGSGDHSSRAQNAPVGGAGDSGRRHERGRGSGRGDHSSRGGRGSGRGDRMDRGPPRDWWDQPLERDGRKNLACIPDDVREARLKKGACLWCGSTTKIGNNPHMVANCPEREPVRPARPVSGR